MSIIHWGLIDTHCHLTDEKYKDLDLSLLIQRCKDQGITQLITIGVNKEDSEKALYIATEYDNVFSSYGIHPSCAVGGEVITKKDEEKIIELAENPNLIAIGECGLDFYWEGYKDHKKQQIELFEKQINLSIILKLPLIIHARESHKETIKLLKNYPKAFGIIHCFTGNKEDAKKYLNLGFYISFSGIVTFQNAKLIQEAVKVVPLNRILVETDSPYLTPEPFRGQINYPYYVDRVSKKIAELKDITLPELIQIISINVAKLFKI